MFSTRQSFAGTLVEITRRLSAASSEASVVLDASSLEVSSVEAA